MAAVSSRADVHKYMCEEAKKSADILEQRGKELTIRDTKLLPKVTTYFQTFTEKHDEFLYWRGQIQSVQDVAYEEIKKICEEANAKYDACLKNVVTPLVEQTIEGQLPNVEASFQTTLESIKVFRPHRSTENHENVYHCYQTFKQHASQVVSLSEKCSSLKPELKTEAGKIKQQLGSLEKQIDLYQMSEALVLAHQVGFALGRLPDNEMEWKSTTASFDHQVSQLPKEMQTKIDERIYLLSPEPKGGKNWGKEHRYDNLTRFHEALLSAIRETNEEKIKTKLKVEKIPDSFYKGLHGIALGPTSKHPVEWAQKQFSYLADFIDDAIAKMG